MDKYTPLPSDVVKLVIRRWNCGDEVCNCNYFWIQGLTNTPSKFIKGHVEAHHLWEGTWFTPDDLSDGISKWAQYSKEAILDELVEACKYYKLPIEKIEIEDFWDIEDTEYIL
jgi:hypothetical protein